MIQNLINGIAFVQLVVVDEFDFCVDDWLENVL